MIDFKKLQKGYVQHKLLYCLSCPTPYADKMNTPEGKKVLLDVVKKIARQGAIKILSLGGDEKHIHFFVRASPTDSAEKIAKTITTQVAINAKKKLFASWEDKGNFWPNECFMSTIDEDEFATRMCGLCKFSVMPNIEQIYI